MKIGILQTGHLTEELNAIGTYPVLFQRLLANRGFAFETYVVVDGVFPGSVTDCDGWLITGSRHGAYEDLPWIAPLEAFIRDAFTADIPVAGICFGHQIMAQALGGTVEKFAGGWSVGAQRYRLQDREIDQFAWHQDQVVAIPDGAEVIASNEFCHHAGLSYGRQGLSVQWHPEFEAPFIDGLIRWRGPGIVPDPLLEHAASSLDTDVDNAALADLLTRFFQERRIA